MALSRGGGNLRATSNAATPSRRTTRSTRTVEDNVPNIYQDLLAEVAAEESANENTDRPLKKRRVVASVSIPGQGKSGSSDSANLSKGRKSLVAPPTSSQQTIEDSSEVESGDDDDNDDDESDLAFEDVDLDQPVAAPLDPEGDNNSDIAIQDVTVTVDTATTTPKRRTQTKRNKPITTSEKAFRLLVHKAHILCLLGHSMYINGRCNNELVHRQLRPKLSKKTISYLNPKRNDSQFQQNRSFMDGLQQASETFRGLFSITASGMRRARWPVDGDEGDEGQSDSNEAEPIDLAEFVQAARDMEGSQDTANQLFCALLRSVGVEARLVCSLQVLPFGNVSVKSATPQKYAKPTFYYPMTAPTTDSAATSDSNAEGRDTSVESSTAIGKVPSVRRRIGQPTFDTESTLLRTSPKKKKKPIRKLSYPIFWTEAFNTAQQKWIPVDPIVTQTVAKASKIEPPSSYEWNQMAYVIAFEADGVARDVTRRYTRAFNAKTRRLRVESTDQGGAGTSWLKKALRIFRRRRPILDREQLEDAELAQREAREGLPSNVQDFKHHPFYALERHLKRNEVISPRREVGKVNAGTAAKPRMEAVFRREDLKVVRAAEKWFRVGRVVKVGEVGLKRVPARKGRVGDGDGDEEREGDSEGGGEGSLTALYALSQTEAYVPPPVVKGRVPRNAYGNLDVYVPSMVPAGGTHVRHALAQQAARILKVDFADAVTGFQFKGRHGTAVVEGAVVAEQYADAVRAAIEGLEDERMEEESKARSAMALRVWRRFLTGLRIKERVNGYGDSKRDEDVRREIDEVEDGQGEVVKAGGFFPGEAGEDVAMPTAGRFSLDELITPGKKIQSRGNKKKVEADSEEEAEFSPEDEEGDVQPSKRSTHRSRHAVQEDSEDEYMPDALSLSPNDGGGGGFLPEDAEEIDGYGGGFLLEDGMNDEGHEGGLLSDDDAVMEVSHDRENGARVSENEVHVEPTSDNITRHPTDIESDNGSTMRQINSPKFVDVTNDATILGQAVDTNQVLEAEQAHLANSASDLNLETNLPDLDGQLKANIDDETMTSSAQKANEASKPIDYDVDGESDRGSMISQDPDDEDAEPDWLEMDSD